MSIHSIIPLFPPFGDNGRTDGTPVLLRVDRLHRSEDHAIWHLAPLTAYARAWIPARAVRAYAVATVDPDAPIGLLVVLSEAAWRGWRDDRLLTPARPRAPLGRGVRQVVVTATRVECTAPTHVVHGLRLIAGVVRGCTDPPRWRERRIDPEDIAALATLAW